MYTDMAWEEKYTVENVSCNNRNAKALALQRKEQVELIETTQCQQTQTIANKRIHQLCFLQSSSMLHKPGKEEDSLSTSMSTVKAGSYSVNANNFSFQVELCTYTSSTKLTADFTMTRISNVIFLLNHSFLVCTIHNHRCETNVCMREIGCCQLGVYIPFWEFPCIRKIILKAVDTIGNCQRLAFTVGVSKHMHKITNL